jgi:hypothetical protein
MAKGISILIIVCLCLMFIMGVGLYAETTTNPAPTMEEHIEKVKLSNPEEYDAMIERAGGNITDCCSCHKGLCQENSS